MTNDPLLQTRLFSYVDTQLTRLGGPNFTQIPVNRPHAPVNDMTRDGFHQHAEHTGVAPYKPNSLDDGGCPFFAGAEDGAYLDAPVTVAEARQGAGQPGVLPRPLQPGAAVLGQHDAGREGAHHPGVHLRVGKCYEQAIKERQLQALANIDPVLCSEVATGLGLPGTRADGPPRRRDAEPRAVAGWWRVATGTAGWSAS